MRTKPRALASVTWMYMIHYSKESEDYSPNLNYDAH